MTFPIVAPEFGDDTDPEWAGDVTDAVNDHETRIAEVEFLNVECRDMSYWTGGALATSSGSETAFAAWTADKAFTLLDGRVYALEVACTVYNAQAAFGTMERVQINIRKAVNSTSAQLLGAALLPTHGAGTGGAAESVFTRYVANQTGADLTGIHIGLTVQRVTGSAVNTLYGDASFPCSVTVRDMGSVANVPNLAALAVEIT